MAENRLEIVTRGQAKAAARPIPPPTRIEIDHGVPVFLDQLVDGGALRLGPTSSPEIGRSAVQHGHDMLLQGFTGLRSCTTMATSARPSPSSPWKPTRLSARRTSVR